MIKDTLLSLLSSFGPSGCEDGICQTIRELVTPLADDVYTDALGNLYAIRHGEGKRILLTAHMDSLGIVVVDANKSGYLRVSNLGGITPADAAWRHIVFQNGVKGILCVETLKDDEKLNWNKMYVDIGTSNRDEALAQVPVGTMAVLDTQTTEMGDYLCAPYLDNRSGCAVLVDLLEALESRKNEVIAVFTVQEEVGLRGAVAAAYSSNADIGIAVDVTDTGDYPGAHPMAVKLGAGPAVKYMDACSVSTPSVRDGLISAAELADIPFQREVLTFGGTDAASIQRSRAGIPCATLSIPCRNIHTATEMISTTDLAQCVELLKTYIEEIV